MRRPQIYVRALSECAVSTYVPIRVNYKKNKSKPISGLQMSWSPWIFEETSHMQLQNACSELIILEYIDWKPQWNSQIGRSFLKGVTILYCGLTPNTTLHLSPL